MRIHNNFSKTLFAIGLSACMTIASAQTPGSQSQVPPSDPTDRQRPGPGIDPTGRPGDPNVRPTFPQTDSTTESSRNRTEENTGLVGQSDHKFIMEAAQGSMMEVKLAQMAQEKASSDDVKQLAKQIETDHSQASEELQKLASAKQVALPSEMGKKHQKNVSKLEELSGAEFDKEYTKLMVKDHKDDVKKFERQAEKGMDADVKAFAQKTVAVLQGHLQTAQNLQNTSMRSRTDDSATRSSDQTTSPSTTSPSTTSPSTRDSTTQKPQGENNPTPRP